MTEIVQAGSAQTIETHMHWCRPCQNGYKYHHMYLTSYDAFIKPFFDNNEHTDIIVTVIYRIKLYNVLST
jgi:hypothetical protein